MPVFAGQKLTAAFLNAIVSPTVRYIDDGLSSPQSFPDGNSTIVKFRTARTVNPAVVAVSGTGNDTYTVQQTGEYELTAGWSGSSGSSVVELTIQVNGTNLVGQTSSLGTASVATNTHLNAGDVVKVNVFQASGGARTTKSGFGDAIHISIKLKAAT